jgi:hypothetical protein
MLQKKKDTEQKICELSNTKKYPNSEQSIKLDKKEENILVILLRSFNENQLIVINLF